METPKYKIEEYIKLSDINIIPPINNGIDLIKKDIISGERVFCTSMTGREYQIAIQDAYDILEESLNTEHKHATLLKKIYPSDKTDNTVIYVPQRKKDSKESIEKIKYYIEKINKTNKNISNIYPNYNFQEPLNKQLPNIIKKYSECFLKLNRMGIIPHTMSDYNFNTQAMYFMMEGCFKNIDLFKEYLKNPYRLNEKEIIEKRAEKKLHALLEVQNTNIILFLIKNNGFNLDVLQSIIDPVHQGKINLIAEKNNLNISKLTKITHQLLSSDIIINSEDKFHLTTKGRTIIKKIIGQEII